MLSKLILQVSSLAAVVTSALAAPAMDNYHIIFADDFNGASGDRISFDTWDYVTRGPPNNANNEIEFYGTSSTTSHLSGGGTALIRPVKQSDGTWWSARLESKGSWTCANGKRMVIQSKIKVGQAPANQQQGIWPAFWVLGDSGRHGVRWPANGELDIMEQRNGQSINGGTPHYGRTNNVGSDGASIGFDRTQFNTYGVKINREAASWLDQDITWWLNGVQYHQITGRSVQNRGGVQADWVSLAQSPLYIVMNVAVGGNYPGNPNSSTASGQSVGIEVDYVAVYARD